jgi:glycine oxidase
MLAPFADARQDDPLFGLAIRGRDLYRDLVPELQEETGVDIGLWAGGIIHVAYSPADVDRLKADVAWQRQDGLTTEWLDAEHMRELVPGISPDAWGALHAVEDGALDPRALRQALQASAANKGVALSHNARVQALRIQDGRVTGVRTATGDRPAGAVLIAAGCWSGRIAGLPRPLAVEPIRGQMVALEWPPGEPTSIAFGPACYVVRRGNEALVGATMEYVGFDASVTQEAVDRLVQAAARLYPALASRPPLRKWAGLRPMAPDGYPYIGADPDIAGLWYATGHGRNGVVLAGITGRIIAALYAGQPVEHDLKRVFPGRFWSYAHLAR